MIDIEYKDLKRDAASSNDSCTAQDTLNELLCTANQNVPDNEPQFKKLFEKIKKRKNIPKKLQLVYLVKMIPNLTVNFKTYL